MVRTPRPEPPPLLVAKQKEWTIRWIESRDKDKNWATRTASKLLKNALLTMTHGKCAYCENLLLETFPVEHFLSKSESREHAFQWENLFPACHDCNSKKGSRSPEKEIIRPDREPDSEDYFDVNVKGQLVPHSKIADDAFAEERVRLTIEFFGLNRGALCRIRNTVMDDVRRYKKKSLGNFLDPTRPFKLVIRKTLRDIGRTDLAAEDKRRFEAPPQSQSTI